MEPILLRADRAGERADQLLARLVPELTRSAAQRLLEAGAVTLGGRPVKKNDKAAAGDVLEVRLPEPEPVDVLPQAIPLDVAYEDADVIVVNKPVGLVVHPAAGHPDGTLVNALLYHCGELLSGINGALRPGIVHRIDRDTSGLLIAAKNDFAHQALAAQLQDHSLYREYEAVCVGGLREDRGTVDAPIGRHPTDRKKMCVDWKNGRPAVTHWTVSGDRPHPPDPGASGLHRPPPAGGRGIRGQEARPRPGGPVPSRQKALLCPPPHRGAGHRGVPPACLFYPSVDKAAPFGINSKITVEQIESQGCWTQVRLRSGRMAARVP